MLMQYLEDIISDSTLLKKNQLMGDRLWFLALGIGSHFITQSFVYMLVVVLLHLQGVFTGKIAPPTSLYRR